ncbi:MAG: hypothetical protein K2M42_01465 [Oscillospiraceae bacterium]|nr:hypothetical protein [Oscillospiraceae bacterium]
MIRATTGGVMLNYRRNLMNSFIGMSNAHNTILTQRNFNSYAEDPASAAKAFKLRKSRMSVETQYTICGDTFHKYETAFASLQSIDEVLDTKTSEHMKTLSGTTLTELNDPTGDARQQLTKVLDQMSEMLVQNLNQKYGENFIFAGADGHNVPFEIKNNQLYYRGVSVDAAEPEVVTNFGTTNKVTADNGDYIPASAATINQAAFDALDPAEQGEYVHYQVVTENGQEDRYVLASDTISEDDYNTAKTEADKLKYLANEKYFVDIGLGFQENENGQLIESSGFNASLVGINFFGYGKDEDGDPKNIYSIVQKLKDISARVHDGENWTNEDYDEFFRLTGKLETASSKFKTEFTDMAAGTDKLENNLELLENNYDNLVEQYGDMEDADMVESITSFIWAQYCYNAALKVGNSVLSQSLMDYLS